MRWALALAMLLAGCGAQPQRLAPPVSLPVENTLTLPMRDEHGVSHQLAARLCRPPGSSPAPLVVINHGAPAERAYASLMVPTSCGSGPARWFNARGYAVLFALRRGFGTSTGEAASSGRCNDPDYVSAGLAEARDIAAIVEYGQGLSGIARDGLVVVGQSTGGWAVLAYDTLPHPPLVGMIVVAGGRGQNEASCRPERLIAGAARFGTASRTPMLWVYARSDLSFGPQLAVAMHEAFTHAGGRAELVQPEVSGPDGHGLFYMAGGDAVWGPIFDRYLKRR